MFIWYWLADLCLELEIKFILDHATYRMLRYSDDAKAFLKRKEKKYGKARARTMLARKIARDLPGVKPERNGL